MSFPKLFGANGEPMVSGVPFVNNGFGMLSDAVSCNVVQQLNGQVEAVLQYPQDGKLFGEISEGRIIVCRPDMYSDAQPFRIYRSAKPLAGVVTFYARHLAYDLAGIPVAPFTASTATAALQGLKSNALITNPFSYETDVTGSADFSVDVPSSAFSAMGGKDGSVLDVYGGEYEYNWHTVYLRSHRGSDRHVEIAYGKNLMASERDRNSENMYSGVVPFWTKDGTVITGSVSAVPGTFPVARVLPLDCTEKHETQPTQAQLTADAQEYISTHELAIPSTGWKVEFALLTNADEYRDLAIFEKISLGDTVHVVFKDGEKVSARAVETSWNVLLERYNYVTLGRIRANIADTVVEQAKEIKAKPSVAMAERISEEVARFFIGADGGCVRLIDANGDGQPDELYIADNVNPAQAVKVIRANYNGIAFSSSGYNGPWTAGIGVDGKIAAWMVTAANLVAGTIKSADNESFVLDLDSSSMSMKNGTITMTGTTSFSRSQYSSYDTDRIGKILVGKVVPSATDVLKYDMNGDGKLTITDAVLVSQMAAGQYSTLRVDWRLTISVSGPGLVIHKKTTLDGVVKGDIDITQVDGGGVSATNVGADIGTFDSVAASKATIDGTLTAGSVSTDSLTVDGKAVVVHTQIGTFVYGTISGESKMNCAFIPLGISGSFQLGVGAKYIAFTIDAWGNVSGSVYTEDVYND